MRDDINPKGTISSDHVGEICGVTFSHDKTTSRRSEAATVRGNKFLAQGLANARVISSHLLLNKEVAGSGIWSKSFMFCSI